MEYIEQIKKGKVSVGKWVELAVERHLRDLKDLQGYYFDQSEADKVIKFCQLLRYHKGSKAGERIILEPHQVFYFSMIYGWKRNDGIRRFRTSYKEVARKNGKTTETALKAIYSLLADKENSPQIYFVATKEDQARIGFDDCVEIIKKTKELSPFVDVFKKSIVSKKGGFIKPLGSDSNTQDGFDPSHGIIDEYHAHKNDGMLNVIESGMGARIQPLIDIITTAGFNQAGPCYRLRKVVMDILEGKLQDETTFGIIYTLDKEDDFEDSKTWIKANPNLGVSVNPDFLSDRLIKGKNEGSTKLIDFKTKNLNIWTNQQESWIEDKDFMKNEIKEPDLKGVPCIGGLDLAATKDFNAFALLFDLEDYFYMKWYFWLPEDTLEIRTKKEGVDYLKWVEEGYLKTTPGNVADYEYIQKDILDLREKYDIQEIHYDRAFSVNLVSKLSDEGLKMFPFSQATLSMSAPSKQFERLVMNGGLKHDGNPIARWMLGNVALRTDAEGNYKPDKSKSEEKIDGIIASIIAIGGYMTNQKEEDSVYNDKGFFIL